MRDAIVDLLTLPMPILWLLVLGLVLWRWMRLSRALFLTATVLFLAISLPASGKLMVSSLQGGAPAFDGEAQEGTSAILVPSGGTIDDGTGRWWPSTSSILRLASALRLRNELSLPVILSGGSPKAGQLPEAETLAASFDLHGPDVRLETRARDSNESAKAVARLLAGEANPRVILVTSAVHVARMSAVLRHHGIDVVAVAGVGIAPNGWTPGDFLPSYRGFKMNQGAFREYMVIAWYLATGRLSLRDL